jgi:CCR4-NOT transcription complex subunit 4
LQKNLVYVVGLSQKMADVEILKKQEFFGRFGKIVKIAVGTTPLLNNAGQQTSCTAYVTYIRDDDALRAIEAVNNAVLDGRLLKASLGTTKYCSTFLRGQTCHKTVCSLTSIIC